MPSRDWDKRRGKQIDQFHDFLYARTQEVYGEKPKLCSKCGKPRRTGGSRCLECHAKWMRDWRQHHPLTPEQKFKSNARSYANVYQRRGKLKPQPCEVCGSPAQKHHDDYARPLDVHWLCRQHHLSVHRSLSAVV